MPRKTHAQAIKRQERLEAGQLKAQLETLEVVISSLRDERTAIYRYIERYVKRFPQDTVLLHELMIVLHQLDTRIARVTEVRDILGDRQTIRPRHDANWRAIRLWQAVHERDLRDVLDYPEPVKQGDLSEIF